MAPASSGCISDRERPYQRLIESGNLAVRDVKRPSPPVSPRRNMNPGEVAAQRLQAVAVDADEPGQGRAELLAVGSELVVHELQELPEFHRAARAEVHGCCPAAWRMAAVTSARLRGSRPGMASRRLTG
jgi:hypothetical protein